MEKFNGRVIKTIEDVAAFTPTNDFKYILFLDDERFPGRSLDDMATQNNCEIIISRTAEAAAALIKKCKEFPIYISFDNDLGEGIMEGDDLAKMIISLDLDGVIDIPSYFKFHVHSMNVVKNPIIKSRLQGYIDWKFQRKDFTIDILAI